MSNELDQHSLKAATRVTLVGAVLDLVLGVLKIIVGLTANSFALVSDGIHSLSDLVTDAFVLLVARISHAKPDQKHPYGHRRFETLGTIILGIVLFGVASVICFDSIRRLYQQQSLPVPGWTGLVIALFSILSKEWIYRYTRQVALKTNSSLLLANAWHSRTDALSSVAVFIGVLGAMLGYPITDLLAAIFVALMIGKIAWDLISTSLQELVDTAVPEGKVEKIRQHIRTIEGIRDSHELRTRLHGGRIFVDLHLQVDNRISVSEGHYLADHVSASLRHHFPDIADVVVHIDPELDDSAPVLDLPLRHEVESMLFDKWNGLLDPLTVHRIDLHYLENHVEAEIYIDKNIINNDLKGTLDNTCQDFSWLRKITFYEMP